MDKTNITLCIRTSSNCATILLFIGILVVFYSMAEYLLPYVGADVLVEISQTTQEKEAMRASFSTFLDSIATRRAVLLFVAGGCVCAISARQLMMLRCVKKHVLEQGGFQEVVDE